MSYEICQSRHHDIQSLSFSSSPSFKDHSIFLEDLCNLSWECYNLNALSTHGPHLPKIPQRKKVKYIPNAVNTDILWGFTSPHSQAISFKSLLFLKIGHINAYCVHCFTKRIRPKETFISFWLVNVELNINYNSHTTKDCSFHKDWLRIAGSYCCFFWFVLLWIDVK